MTKQPKKYLFEYNMLFVNFLSLIVLLISCFFIYLLYRLNLLNNLISNASFYLQNEFSSFQIFVEFIILFSYMGLHELIHALFYYLNGAKWSNIKLGIALEKGILFTKCAEYVDKKNILISVIAPFVILGLITITISIIFGLPFLFVLSLYNIMGCSGDLMMFNFFLHRDSNIKFKEFGDSSTFILETSENLEDKKFSCIKLKEVLKEEPLDQKFIDKINISKPSKWFLIIILLVFILNFLIDIFIK